jgi:hypothetical protein
LDNSEGESQLSGASDFPASLQIPSNLRTKAAAAGPEAEDYLEGWAREHWDELVAYKRAKGQEIPPSKWGYISTCLSNAIKHGNYIPPVFESKRRAKPATTAVVEKVSDGVDPELNEIWEQVKARAVSDGLIPQAKVHNYVSCCVLRSRDGLPVLIAESQMVLGKMEREYLPALSPLLTKLLGEKRASVLRIEVQRSRVRQPAAQEGAA